jgi:hypothetical protein
MKLYYHKTDGGAEYYCLKPIAWGDSEGDLSTAVLRTDGDELEIFTRNLYDEFKKIVIS